MLKSKILELYSGQAPVASSDQETREEYEARRKAKKDKKKKKHHKDHDDDRTEGGGLSKPKVIQQILHVKDAEEEPFSAHTSSMELDHERKVQSTKPQDSNDEGARGRRRERRRERVDSSSESDVEEEDSRPIKRRPRLETSSSDEVEGPRSQSRPLQLDSDDDVAVNRKRSRRDRTDSNSSESDLKQGANATAGEIDSDGDVVVTTRRGRRRSSSSSSSEEDDRPVSTIGLKSKEEFARIMEAKDQATTSELDEYGLGKGQATVYRDKRTGEISQAPTKTQQEIERENEILTYDLNMGAMDKLMIKGVSERKKAEDEILDDDPMARFLRKSTPEDEVTLTGKPKYKGRAPPPNRFQIPPGYRWDGVDRSNGFESKLLRKRNERLAQ